MLCVDECAFLTTPLRKRTWAPEGAPPVLQHLGSRKKVTAVAGLGLMPSGRVTGVFELFGRDLNWEDFFHWLVEVHGHYHRKLIVVWDNLKAHLKAVSAFRDLEVPWIEFRQLPSYAPDLAAVEGLWCGTKYHSMANFAAADYADLEARARRELQRCKRTPRFLKSCFAGAGLKIKANLCRDQ